MRRSTWVVALAAGLALVAAACDDDGEPAATDAPEAPAATDASAATDAIEVTGVPEPTDVPDASQPTGSAVTTAPDDALTGSGDAAMTITIDLNPDAVWEDGTPITAADFECTWRANLNTPGSINTVGYDRIVAVSAGDSDRQVVVELDQVYGPYKTLFNPLLKATAVADCDDVSADFATAQPVSGRPYRIASWSESELVLVPNENYWGDDQPVTERVVMVPQLDTATEIASLQSGQTDFIFPQFDDSLAPLGDDPDVELAIAAGGDYEALYFQQLEGPFADPVFREAFSKSIDREALYAEIYEPFLAAVGVEGELLNCGPIVPGPYCPAGNFQDTFDPAAAETLLTDAGWRRDAAGFWAKDGAVPEIHWMVNAGNTRRERTQDYLIPQLADAGFNVVADNCEAECVFEQRLPLLDYDLAMYIETAQPDPTYLTPRFTCDNIPTEENRFAGRNQQGWCNQEASDALHQADATVDRQERIDLVQDALRAMDTDDVLLPLVNLPNAGAWRADKVAGPISAELSNDRAFINFHLWEDSDGDGQIVIGAEQWPSCLNPVTECAEPLWYSWTIAFPTFPGVWDTTADQTYEITDLVLEEPTVELAE